jgi:hypothetical protein
MVVLTLALTGGGKAVSDNAALIGALVALGGVFTAQMVGITLDDRRTQEAREFEARRAHEAAELEAQRAHETALQNYFAQVGSLLIEKPLHEADPGDNLSTVVRAQTLTVLESLEPHRKRILLQFLYESGLVATPSTVVSLEGANLREADLFVADLSEANLRGANLFGADLSSADLRWADLRDAKGYTNLLLDNLLLEGHAASLEGATMPDGSKHA